MVGWFLPPHQASGALGKQVSTTSKEMAPELVCFTTCVIVLICLCNLFLCRWDGFVIWRVCLDGVPYQYSSPRQKGLAEHMGSPVLVVWPTLFCKLLASWCGEECMKSLRTAEWDSSTLSRTGKQWSIPSCATDPLWSWPGCICRGSALSKLCWKFPNWSLAWKTYLRVCPMTVIAMRCRLMMKLPEELWKGYWGTVGPSAPYKLYGGQVAAWMGLDAQRLVPAQSATLGCNRIGVCSWNPLKLPVH